MAFVDEWVDKRNKTADEPGDKIKADDVNLLAQGIKEALSSSAPDYGALKIEGDENSGSISAINSDNPWSSVLDLSSYTLRLSGSVLELNISNLVAGLRVARPVNYDDATSKGYVDELVGNVESALDTIIAMQNSLIGGEA